MNILILGYSDSIFTRDFCVSALGKDDINTVILTPTLAKQYRQDYRDNQIKEIKWPNFFQKGILKQIFVLPKIIKEWDDLKTKIGFGNQIDAVYVHYVEPLHIMYFFDFWLKARKRILVFWGSDLLRASKKKLLLFPYFLKHSTAIVLMVPSQCDYFYEVFSHKYDDKIHVIDFGNSLLDEIDNVAKQFTVEKCKNFFGLSTNKVIIHVGYNASRGQQHKEMLENIVLLPQETLHKMQFVFHVSYGYGNDFDSYKQQLKEIMDAEYMDYVFVDSYLQGEELAMFRLTCDVFLYGQKTDARSASPLEYIYAGAEFVCPKWLSDNYKLLKQTEIRPYVYNDFSNIGDSLQLCLEKINLSDRKINEQGRKTIRDEISWDSLAEKWRALYE